MLHPNDFNSYDNNSYRIFTNPAIIEKDLQTLMGILEGIRMDEVINDIELTKLQGWIAEYRDYENKQPYSEVIEYLRNAISDGYLSQDEIENVIWFCNNYINHSGYFDELTSSIQELCGIIQGIALDGTIHNEELHSLWNWMEDNQALKNTYPYDEVYNLLVTILKDNKITLEEKEEFLRFSNSILNLSNTDENTTLVSSLNTGYFQIDPEITIQESLFCITGSSKKYKRKEIAEKIELYGGFLSNGITQKLNYLVVCAERNTCWAFTCYGRKIEEAVQLRKKGFPIAIVHEYDLYDTLEDL